MAQIQSIADGAFHKRDRDTVNSNFNDVYAQLAALPPTVPLVSGNINPAVIQYATVLVPNASVLTLFGTGTPLIAAQGANTVIEVVEMFLENVFLTGAFTAGGVIQASYGAGVTNPATATIAATFLTSPAASQVTKLAGVIATVLKSTIANTAVNLACATQEFATGAGSMIVKIAFRVHTGL